MKMIRFILKDETKERERPCDRWYLEPNPDHLVIIHQGRREVVNWDYIVRIWEVA